MIFARHSPTAFACSACGEKYLMPAWDVGYFLGKLPFGSKIADADLMSMPVRPAWCKDCDKVCKAEDIAPLRVFENALGATRAGVPIEYPFDSRDMDPAHVRNEMAAALAWRMARRGAARALCCGGSNFQYLDVAQPLLKHAVCDFGFIEPVYEITIRSYCGPGPAAKTAVDVRIFDSEGELVGSLSARNRDDATYDAEPTSYPRA
ncbi:MAG: hypothetical protein ACJ8GW_01805 [Massilia sp.]